MNINSAIIYLNAEYRGCNSEIIVRFRYGLEGESIKQLYILGRAQIVLPPYSPKTEI